MIPETLSLFILIEVFSILFILVSSSPDPLYSPIALVEVSRALSIEMERVSALLSAQIPRMATFASKSWTTILHLFLSDMTSLTSITSYFQASLPSVLPMNLRNAISKLKVKMPLIPSIQSKQESRNEACSMACSQAVAVCLRSKAKTRSFTDAPNFFLIIFLLTLGLLLIALTSTALQLIFSPKLQADGEALPLEPRGTFQGICRALRKVIPTFRILSPHQERSSPSQNPQMPPKREPKLKPAPPAQKSSIKSTLTKAQIAAYHKSKLSPWNRPAKRPTKGDVIHLDSMTLPKEVFITRKFNMMFFDENGVAMHKTINLDEFERVWDMEKLERRGCTCKIGDKERQKASEERSEEDSENEKKHEPPEIELEGEEEEEEDSEWEPSVPLEEDSDDYRTAEYDLL